MMKLNSNINQKRLTGPFDIIGDVHGCYEELQQLLQSLGHGSALYQRQLIFLGDLVDRGPYSRKVVNLVMQLVEQNQALCVLGNHDHKFMRYLQGKQVQITHGLDCTIEDYRDGSADEKAKVINFYSQLPSQYVLDEGRLVVAHAGMTEILQGRESQRALFFGLYGQVTNQLDEQGMPIRGDWAKDYAGKAKVIYGHTVVDQVEWRNNTLCIDTGCVFGGRLTALRYPELELVSVAAKIAYCQR